MKNIELALEILQNNISEINTVSEWSDALGFHSNKLFSRHFRNYYGVRPKEMITKTKIQKIKECLLNSPNEILFCIARELGFPNDQALYMFVKRHTGKSPSELKKYLVN